jgi:transposase-like protein
MTIKFTGRHFPSDIILQAVRYYVSYKLSYREIEEILAERGIDVDHSTINRWVIKYTRYWSTEHAVRRDLPPLRGVWMRPTLTSKVSGSIITGPLISTVM